MDEWEEAGKELRRNKAINTLAPRELQVFLLSGRGKTVTEIAIMLKISNRTVTTYRTTILEKMEFENMYDVMSYCIRNDMYTDEFMEKYIK